MIQSLLSKIRTFKAGIEMLPVMTEHIRQATAEGRLAALLADPRYQHSGSLIRHRFKLFSQYGQDGIIGEIFKRIGSGSRKFVEIGTAPLENNTSALLLQGWSGLWMDAALPEAFPDGLEAAVRERRLACERSFLNKENVVELLRKHGFGEGVDFLGVDIDYNTYHILDACVKIRPRVISVEYNSQFPPDIDWVVPYDKDAVWDYSLAYGASLKALERRLREDGYSLVCCELSGTDAFFVRDDEVGNRFHPPFTAEHHWEPMRFWLDSKPGHRPAFPCGLATGR